MEISGTSLNLNNFSINAGNVESVAQVKVLKGANEQLETVVGTILNGIQDIGNNLDITA